MLTLSVMVLVFLVGHWLGFRKAQAQTRKDAVPILAALDEIKMSVLGETCPHCSATGTFEVDVEGQRRRICNACLRATHVYLDDGR